MARRHCTAQLDDGGNPDVEKRLLIALIGLLLSSSTAQAWPTHCSNTMDDADEAGIDCGGSCPACVTSVTQYGITWTFDKGYRTGVFANGDYWVLGPVTITAISPDLIYSNVHGSQTCSHEAHCTEVSQPYLGTYPYNPSCIAGKCEYFTARNGWEVNPEYDRTANQGSQGFQGFDSRFSAFDGFLVPQLPYTAQPGQSIVKGVSNMTGPCGGFEYVCLNTAAVLTILGSVPPDDGATVFRPPYVGKDKPLYSTKQLRTDLLSQYTRFPEAVSLSWIASRFSKVQMHHEPGNGGRSLAPIDNFQNSHRYGPSLGVDNSQAALGLMLDDTKEAKMPALIAYVQTGIDWLYMVKEGKCWCEGGPGIEPGFKIVPVFAATMLDDTSLKAIVRNATFPETTYIKYRADNPRQALFGSESYWSEQKYWEYVVKKDTGVDVSTSAYRDPYYFIDGELPEIGYASCCFPGSWKGSALAVRLMPQMLDAWGDPLLLDYEDRWVNIGYWTQPDPCAPHDGSMANYGMTFGPDGNGSCIKDTDPSDGIGRYPQRHSFNKDFATAYTSAAINRMWQLYRPISCYDGRCEAGETKENCEYDCASCESAADKEPCDGCVSNSELIDFMAQWKAGGQITLTSLMQAISLWKGCS
jgi:hypothetical protein